jgi:hypothetical protein
LGIFEIGSQEHLPSLASDHDPPDLCLTQACAPGAQLMWIFKINQRNFLIWYIHPDISNISLLCFYGYFYWEVWEPNMVSDAKLKRNRW